MVLHWGSRSATCRFQGIHRKFADRLSGQRVLPQMASMNQTAKINIEDLRLGIVGLTQAMGSFYAETASVCLDDQGHSSPTPMNVIMLEKQATVTTMIDWVAPAGPAKANSDLQEATEYGSYGIAALIACKPRGLEMQRSAKGTGIDFWLTPGPLMQRSARLEVSGILRGPERIGERAKQKLKQTQKSAGRLPVTVVIVEFSRPESWIVEDERKHVS